MSARADWAALGNRLLLLQEAVVGLNKASVAELVLQAERGVSWLFDGATLHPLPPEALTPPPLITRGRTYLEGLGEVYLAYFPGPPEPRYLALCGVDLRDAQEFRLAALFTEHLLAALEAAGYRAALEKEARRDWLTGLGNRRALEHALRSLGADGLVGLLEVRTPPVGAPGPSHDLTLKRVAERLTAALAGVGRAYRVADWRFALVTAQTAREPLETTLAVLESPFRLCWANTADTPAESVLDHLGRRLDEDGVRPSAEAAVAEATVVVHSGYEQVRIAYQQAARGWPFTDTIHLILDGPYGYALERLQDDTRPALVVTDSPSHAYLHDLMATKPEGLVVGPLTEPELVASLGRVLAGETFYSGPILEDDDLYPREREVWRLVARGLGNTQIGAQLGVSDKTVANYVTNLQEKLHLGSRVELVLHYLGRLEREDAVD